MKKLDIELFLYFVIINILELLENLVKVIMDMLCSFNNANWIYRKCLESSLNFKPRKFLIY